MLAAAAADRGKGNWSRVSWECLGARDVASETARESEPAVVAVVDDKLIQGFVRKGMPDRDMSLESLLRTVRVVETQSECSSL